MGYIDPLFRLFKRSLDKEEKAINRQQPRMWVDGEEVLAPDGPMTEKEARENMFWTRVQNIKAR